MDDHSTLAHRHAAMCICLPVTELLSRLQLTGDPQDTVTQLCSEAHPFLGQKCYSNMLAGSASYSLTGWLRRLLPMPHL